MPGTVLRTEWYVVVRRQTRCLHGAYNLVGVTSLHKRKTHPDTCITIIPDERHERNRPGNMIECSRGSEVGESGQVARKSLYEEIRQDLKLDKKPFMQGREHFELLQGGAGESFSFCVES